MSTLSARPELTPGRGSALVSCAILALAVATLALDVPQASRSLEKVRAQRIGAALTAHNLVRVINQYRERYGVEPPSNNAQLVKVLAGDNPQKIAFLAVSKRDLNKRGALIDPWGLPYLIKPQEGKSWCVWSCGQDRIDDQGSEKSDDVTSWVQG